MFNLFSRLYFILSFPVKRLNFYFRQFFNFIYPNKWRLIKGEIKCDNMPSFNQITVCQGKGQVEIGENCSFGYKLGGFHKYGTIELQARYKESRVRIGNNISTNNNIMLCAANYIEVGDDTLIGQNVIIMDHEAHDIDPLKRREIGVIGKVVLGKNVWVGNNVTILKNTEIGDNTIIATGAVVSGKFPSNVIIGGVPAKIIKPL